MFLRAKSQCTICSDKWGIQHLGGERMHKTLLRGHHFRSEVLHRQGDVVGGDGEEPLQLRFCAQVGPVGLQEGPQSAVAHVLHDQDVRF